MSIETSRHFDMCFGSLAIRAAHSDVCPRQLTHHVGLHSLCLCLRALLQTLLLGLCLFLVMDSKFLLLFMSLDD